MVLQLSKVGDAGRNSFVSSLTFLVAQTPMEPSKTKHNRSRTIQKLNDARGATRAAGARMVDSNGQAQWDEDEVMMFFWGN